MQRKFQFAPPFPTVISIDREICQTCLVQTKPENEGCKAHAVTTTRLETTPPPPHRVKMPYLNEMYEKKAI